MQDLKYEHRKERARRDQAEQSREARKLPPIPPPVDPVRREACRLDLALYAKTYFAEIFTLPFSKDQLRTIAVIQSCVLDGGLYAEVMPRGSGKTLLLEIAVMWATSYGHRRYAVFIGSKADNVGRSREAIKSHIETNPLLLEDFPEICIPVRALEGIVNRARGQLTHDGKQTSIRWSRDLILPTIEGSVSSGSIIHVAGITAAIRGIHHVTANGEYLRPDLALVDDPQTPESAGSPLQCARRRNAIFRDVKGLSGKGKKMACVVAATVIQKGDVADELLDNKAHPDWRGERMKMVYAFPANEKLWEEYAVRWADSFRVHGDMRDATAFYVEHRAEMDEGCIVAWPEYWEPGEVSGIQHAMNKKISDPPGFLAEYQNEPESESADNEVAILSPDQIAAKLNGIPRGEVPPDATKLTGFIDLQNNLLYWLVAAWSDGFTGYVVDYGTFPRQNTQMFAARTAGQTMARWAKQNGVDGGIEAMWYAALDALTRELLGRDWPRQGGGTRRIDRCFIDSSYGNSTETVYRLCRQSVHSANLRPSHGYGVKPGGKPMCIWPENLAAQRSVEWVERQSAKKGSQYILYNTNYWKTFIHDRLAVSMGGRGCLSLFGRDPHAHQMFAQHLTSESRARLTDATSGRVSDKWTIRPGVTENHWLDGLVGAAAAANTVGVALFEGDDGKVKRYSLAERQRQNQTRRSWR